jgi:hypothetical protein
VNRPPPRGRCYDHNFGDFCLFSFEKIGVFLKKQCHDSNLLYLNKKRQFFRIIFGRSHFQNDNIGPRCPECRTLIVTPIANLPSNIILMRILGNLAKHSGTGDGSQPAVAPAIAAPAPLQVMADQVEPNREPILRL